MIKPAVMFPKKSFMYIILRYPLVGLEQVFIIII